MRARPLLRWSDLHPSLLCSVALLFSAFTSLACPARPARDPRMAGPVQPAARPVQDAPCAQVAPVTCRHDGARLVVRLTAKRRGSLACEVRLAGLSASAAGAVAAVPLQDQGAVSLGERDASLFGGWGRPVKTGVAWESATVAVQQSGLLPEGPTRSQANVVVPCRPGFGEDTQPPAEVAR